MQTTPPTDEPEVVPETTVITPGTTTPAEGTTPETVDGKTEDPDDTVGTGTSIALGCIAGTILLIIIGLIFVAIAALF